MQSWIQKFFRKMNSYYKQARVRMNSHFYRYLLKECGNNVLVYGTPIMHFPERISVDDNTTINHGVIINGRGNVRIGKNVRISQYCVIETGLLKIESIPYAHDTKPIVIGDGVWIASGSLILAGVTISEGSVIGAGSVVTNDIPPNTLAFGVPAKVIREIKRSR